MSFPWSVLALIDHNRLDQSQPKKLLSYRKKNLSFSFKTPPKVLKTLVFEPSLEVWILEETQPHSQVSLLYSSHTSQREAWE